MIFGIIFLGVLFSLLSALLIIMYYYIKLICVFQYIKNPHREIGIDMWWLNNRTATAKRVEKSDKYENFIVINDNEAFIAGELLADEKPKIESKPVEDPKPETRNFNKKFHPKKKHWLGIILPVCRHQTAGKIIPVIRVRMTHTA